MSEEQWSIECREGSTGNWVTREMKWTEESEFHNPLRFTIDDFIALLIRSTQETTTPHAEETEEVVLGNRWTVDSEVESPESQRLSNQHGFVNVARMRGLESVEWNRLKTERGG